VQPSCKVWNSTQSVLGFGGDIPVVAELDVALTYEPAALLVGAASTGGQLPDTWRTTIARALENGLDFDTMIAIALNTSDLSDEEARVRVMPAVAVCACATRSLRVPSASPPCLPKLDAAVPPRSLLYFRAYPIPGQFHD